MIQTTATTSYRPVQRTLIMSLGPLASAILHALPHAFSADGSLAGAIAQFDAGPEDDPSEAIRERLAKISRAGARSELARAGYVLDRLRELALFILVDLSERGSGTHIAAIAEKIEALAQDGWGLDTRVTVIALANDWTAEAARTELRTLGGAMQENTLIIPLNRVNELGLETDTMEAFVHAGATIVEALVVTPLRDALQWLDTPPDVALQGPTLTTIGLSRWIWSPELVREELAEQWRAGVIGQWLAVGEQGVAALTTQRAAGWFGSQGLRPHALATLLERSVATHEVPSWPVPYPWQAGSFVDKLRYLSAALRDGRAGTVELMLADWEEWPIEQEAALRHELAVQLDREPVAGFDGASHFLKELANMVYETAGVMLHRQDLLEGESVDLADRLGAIMTRIDAILETWPSSSPDAWLPMLWRPWRWPGLIREYWHLHKLVQEAEPLLDRQAAVEREQVVISVLAKLYEDYEALINRTAAHLDEVRDMLLSAAPASKAGPARWPATDDNPELEASEAATALGGLGQLALTLDESPVQRLQTLSLNRFGFLLDLPAVNALEAMLVEKQAVAEWWAERWAEATPLWLYDSACQPEENRDPDRSWAAICCAEANHLQALLGLPDRPDWRWLPNADGHQIDILRWRTGVVP